MHCEASSSGSGQERLWLCRGMKQVGFWHSWDSRRKAVARRTGGSWGWGRGVPGETPSILPSSPVSPSLAQSPAGDNQLTLEQWPGRERNAKEKRGGERRRQGAEEILPARPGHGRSGSVHGFKQGEWSNQFQTRLFIIPKQLAFLSVLSPRREVGMGRGRQRIGVVRLHGLWKCKGAGVLGLRCFGALAGRARCGPSLHLGGSHCRFSV